MENYRQKLTVSADDFGIDPKANAAILSLLQNSKIDRVGVLINGTFSPEEIRQLISSDIKIDLHLDFPRPKNYRRKMRESVIGRSLNFLYCYLFGKLKAPVAELEWEKQLQKFRQIFGRLPDGINSHQHIHFFPPYFKLVAKLAEKYSLPYLRFGQAGLVKSSSSVYRILSRLHHRNVSAFSKINIASSDYLISFDWIDNVENFLAYLPEGQTEVVCHPERPEEYAAVLKYF